MAKLGKKVFYIREMLWNGFKRIDFEFEGREAILVCPQVPNEDKKWMIKTEYFDHFKKRY